jgi:hypothetical protein
MQLDRVVMPPGFFAPARTYSLVRDDSGLYLIYTGRAMGSVRGGVGVAGAIADNLLDSTAGKREVAIAAAEQALRRSSAAAMKDTEHSMFVPRAAIKAVVIKDRGVFPGAVVRADKKLTLHFRAHDAVTVRRFFEPYPLS